MQMGPDPNEPGLIVLIGPMGAGKTTLGEALATRLSVEFRDSDRWMERLVGRTGERIAGSDGVAGLHEVELDVFRRMVAAGPPAVIAPAESVVDHEDGRALLRSATTIWLDAASASLFERRNATDHRRSMSFDEFEVRRATRRPHLERCSIASVDTSTAGVEECVVLMEAIVRGTP